MRARGGDVRGKFGNKGVAGVDDEATGAGVAFAGGQVGRLDHEERGRAEVAGVSDDEGVVAAEFEGENFFGRAGEFFREPEAGAGGAGEEEAIEAG